MEFPNISISVILCCYNSSSRLAPTLAHLANQRVNPGFEWEIILVDNNSTDNTADFAQATWKKLASGVSLQVVSEKIPGLANARKKGIDTAKAPMVLFCDDDNWLDENYVQTATHLMQENKQIGMLGGVGEAVSETVLPYWFEPIKLAYAIGPQSDNDGDITYKKGFVYGAGAVLRKTALLEVYEKGFVSLLTDRTGKALVSGGDNEIGYVMAIRGWQIHYCSALKFKHFIPAGRLTPGYQIRLAKGQQMTVYKILAYESHLFNMPFAFPADRFFKLNSSIKQILLLPWQFATGKITSFDLRIKAVRIFYRQYYLIKYYNQFKYEVALVKKNIIAIKD